MNINEIRKKWLKLSSNGGQQIRVSQECLPQLFLSIDTDGKRCLILWLDDETVLDYKSCHKEKISIDYYPLKSAVILKLSDNNFFDLFDDLILSVVNHISNVRDNAEYPKEMFTTFYKWSNFFDDCPNELLKQNVVQGIWGELFVLHQLLLKADSTLLYDNILTSWTGPYRKGHDFETDLIDIEVKTKEVTRQSVKISSEHQLEEQHNKPLKLTVLSVKSDTSNGKSLNDLFLKIKNLIQKGNGDISILLMALSELKLTTTNIIQYENYRFIEKEIVTFDCCNKDFPRFVTSNLRPGQFNIQYELLLSKIQNFIIQNEQFEGGSE